MSVKFENLNNKPVFIRLNSGNTLRISPSTTSPEIQDSEVKNNIKVKKLLNRHVIVQHEVKNKPQRVVTKKEKGESSKGK